MATSMEALLALVEGKRAEIKAKSGGFNNATKPPAGKSRWRILPGWRKADPNVFFHDFGQHYFKDKDGNVKAVMVCEQKTFGHSCEWCDMVGDAIRSTKDDKQLELLKACQGRGVYLVNAVRMDGENKNPKKPVLLQLPTKAMEAYLLLFQERHGDGINILDAKEGRDVVITREGTGLTTTYALNDAAMNSAIDPDALEGLIDIDLWIDSERKKGLSKRTLVAPTVSSILALPITTTARITGPSMSSLVPASRVIEVEAEPVETSVVAPAVAPAVTAVLSAPVVATSPEVPLREPPAAVATPAAPAEASMSDDELAEILKGLD